MKPELVIKGGVPVMGATGSADACIRYAEPVYLRPLWGAVGSAPSRLSLLFTSKLAYEQDLARRCADDATGSAGARHPRAP